MADQPTNTSNDQSEQEKRARHRSPNYPVIGLEKALERAQTIKERALRHFMTVKSAHEAWDYKAAAGDQVVAALKAFGLIEVQGAKEKRQLRLTEAAWRILGNAPDRLQQLKTAALSPEIHREIWEKYDGPPPSDTVLKDYLLWERPHKFNESTVNGFIAQFNSTITFANLDLSDKLPSEENPTAEGEVNPAMRQQPPIKSPHVGPDQTSFGTGASFDANTFQTFAGNKPVTPRKATELAFKLSRGSEAKVTIYGDASQEAIKRLRALLELQEDTFPTDAEIAAQGNYRPAVWRNKDHDQPVTITGELGEHEGKRFYAAKETSTGIPEDELEFETASM